MRYLKKLSPFSHDFWPVPEVCWYAIEQISPAEVSAYTVGGKGTYGLSHKIIKRKNGK
jgi:hypothetical protein